MKIETKIHLNRFKWNKLSQDILDKLNCPYQLIIVADCCDIEAIEYCGLIGDEFRWRSLSSESKQTYYSDITVLDKFKFYFCPQFPKVKCECFK